MFSFDWYALHGVDGWIFGADLVSQFGQLLRKPRFYKIDPGRVKSSRPELEKEMKLSTSLLALVATGAQAQTAFTSVTAASCIECEHVGYATSEDNAVSALNDENIDSKGINYCISGKKGSKDDGTAYTHLPAAWTASTVPSYCVAQFFIYYAKDINK